MPYFTGAGGVWKQNTAPFIGAGGVWKAVLGKWMGVGGVWKNFFTNLAVTANNVSRHTSSFAACAGGTTGTPGAVVSGGSGSYSYSWTRVGACHSNGCLTCANASALNPTWSGSACDDALSPKTEAWQLTVTDLIYGATASASINVTRTHANLS